MSGAAEAYQELGWSVFPVQGKKPMPGSNGLLDATTEPWTNWPKAATGIGLATGAASGIFVVDLDSDDAMESFATMQDDNGGRTYTVCSRTARGYHLFFRMPQGGDIRNSVNLLAKGIDIRGTGGYVVIPPSAHPSGSTYKWAEGRSPDETAIADAPAWLLGRVQDDNGNGRKPVPAPPVEGVITEPGRNVALASLAGTMRRRGMSESEVLAAMLVVGRERCSPPMDELEIVGVVHSIAGRYEPSDGATPIGTTHVFEFVTGAELESRPAPAPLVTDIISEGVLACLFGKPGCAKTFFALDLAHSIATGLPCVGRAVQQGSVVYVLGEGAGGVGQRVRAWRESRQVAPVEDVHFILEAVPLMDHATLHRFVAAIRERTDNPKLVIFDTLARCTLGMEENSARDMGLAIAGADIVRRELGCAVLLIHHTNATGERERGSTALEGAVDVLMWMKSDEMGITLGCKKSKDTEPFEDIRLNLTKCLNSAVLTPISDMGVKGGFLSAGQVLTLRSLHSTPLRWPMGSRSRSGSTCPIRSLRRSTEAAKPCATGVSWTAMVTGGGPDTRSQIGVRPHLLPSLPNHFHTPWE